MKNNSSSSKTRFSARMLVIAGSVFCLILLLGGAVYLIKTNMSQAGVKVAPVDIPIYSTVTISVVGFQPKELTIRKGGIVNIINFSGKDVEIVSADASPNAAFNLGVLKEGDSKDIDTKNLFLGKYTYMNKANPSQKGTFVIK